MLWIIENLVEVVTLFIGVAGNDPVAPLLLLGSVGVLTVALGVFGVMAIGGVLSALAGN